jgi:hypothetical protein
MESGIVLLCSGCSPCDNNVYRKVGAWVWEVISGARCTTDFDRLFEGGEANVCQPY